AGPATEESRKGRKKTGRRRREPITLNGYGAASFGVNRFPRSRTGGASRAGNPRGVPCAFARWRFPKVGLVGGAPAQRHPIWHLGPRSPRTARSRGLLVAGQIGGAAPAADRRDVPGIGPPVVDAAVRAPHDGPVGAVQVRHLVRQLRRA